MNRWIASVGSLALSVALAGCDERTTTAPAGAAIAQAPALSDGGLARRVETLEARSVELTAENLALRSEMRVVSDVADARMQQVNTRVVTLEIAQAVLKDDNDRLYFDLTSAVKGLGPLRVVHDTFGYPGPNTSLSLVGGIEATAEVLDDWNEVDGDGLHKVRVTFKVPFSATPTVLVSTYDDQRLSHSVYDVAPDHFVVKAWLHKSDFSGGGTVQTVSPFTFLAIGTP